MVEVKKGLTGSISWELLSENKETVLFENTNVISNRKLIKQPMVDMVTIGDHNSLGYATRIRLEYEDSYITLIFAGKMDDCFSFYRGGAGYVGVYVESLVPINGKNAAFVSTKESTIQKVARVSHAIIEVTKEFRHAYHSYIGGITFHKDWTYRLTDFFEKADPVYITIKTGSFFALGD